MFSVLILAAGSSSRMGGGNKQLALLAGEPVLRRSVRAFLGLPEAAEVVVVCRPQDEAAYSAALAGLTGYRLLPVGGQTRQQSVMQGLEAVSGEADYLAVHDGARPLVSQQVIADAVLSAIRYGAAAAAVPVADTIKVADADRMICATPDRQTLYAVQTPQVFRLGRYREAAQSAREAGQDFTDDCQMLEAIGQKVYLSRGEYTNLKITTPVDLLIAQALAERQMEEQ